MMKPGKVWCTAEGVASGVSSCFQQRGAYCETRIGRVSLQHAGEVDEDTRELGYGAEGVCCKGTKAGGKLREVYKCFGKRRCLEKTRWKLGMERAGSTQVICKAETELLWEEEV